MNGSPGEGPAYSLQKFVTDVSAPRQAKAALPISEASSGCALGSWVMGRKGGHFLLFF